MTAQIAQEMLKKGSPAALPSARPPMESVIRGLRDEEQVLLTQLLTEPIDFVDHADFCKRGIAKQLFGFEPKLAPRATRFAEPDSVLTSGDEFSSRIPTLTTAQEQRLFMRYNYARSRVALILAKNTGKRLSAAAVRELLAWGRLAISARTAIVRLNLPLVLAMAKRTRLSNVDFNELVSEGNMALLRSVEKFDSSRGFKFSTYACRAILKSFSRVALRASRYRQYFPTEFDATLERSDFAQTQREDVERDCVDELKDILLKNLAGLSDVERTVIQERFAIGTPSGSTAKTLEQVGDIIGVTKERVRQIQNKALQKIRHVLEERYLAA